MAPGSRFDRNPGESEEKYHHLTLLAENETGYRNLLKLVSLRAPRGLLPPAADGQAAAGGARGGRALPLGLPVLRARRGLAGGRPGRDRAARWRPPVPRHLRSRALLHRGPGPRPRRPATPSCARSSRSATNWGSPWSPRTTCTTRCSEDAKPHDVLLCIQQKKLQSDPKRLKFDSDEFYLKSAEEMRAVFARAPGRVRPDAADRRARRAGSRVRGPGARGRALPPAAVRDARRDRPRRLPAPAGGRGRAPSATATLTPEVARPDRPRARRDHVDGLRRVLPDRVGPDPLRARAGDPRRAGPRLGGGVRGLLLPAHHRPRPAALRAAVRAVPEPRARSRCPTSTWTSTSAGATR